MRIDPGVLAKSIGALANLDPDRGFEEGLDRVVTAAKILFDADAAGLMLLAQDGALRWTSASDPYAQAAEDSQEQSGQGPCQQAFARWEPVAVRDLRADSRYEKLVSAMAGVGLRAVLSVPVELQGAPVGALDLYAASPRAWNDSEVAAANTYAGVVGSLLGAALAAHVHGRLAAQLQVALDSRVLIEQAKGVLMASQGLDAQTAFERLRRRARSTSRPVVEVAREVLAAVPHRLESTVAPDGPASTAEPSDADAIARRPDSR
jgi:GAF domain-containing protein